MTSLAPIDEDVPYTFVEAPPWQRADGTVDGNLFTHALMESIQAFRGEWHEEKLAHAHEHQDDKRIAVVSPALGAAEQAAGAELFARMRAIGLDAAPWIRLLSYAGETFGCALDDIFLDAARLRVEM